jgi:hypothetical protein
MMLLAAVLLAASVDGAAALRHASALSALGPRPWGSPRGHAAAEYVAAQLRAAGAADVRIEPFESHGIRGANVVGVLRGRSPEFVVIGAHHDTAPGAPGAYDDAGGVGVVIEAARVLASTPRERTIVLASWDGEEAWSTGLTTTAGSRAHVKALGDSARQMVAALAVEMCGWRAGTPVLHPIAYADPLRPGELVIAPARVMRALLSGSRRAGSGFGVGDPLLSWVYQPAVRTFRGRLYGDDLSFLQAGLPATFTSDSSFARFYPWYHQPTDTTDKLDAGALARMGTAVVGGVEALAALPVSREPERDWFAAFGFVLGAPALWALGLAALVPGMRAGARAGGGTLAATAAQAALALFLMSRHLVPALWALVLPALIAGVLRRWWAPVLALLPPAALLAVGGIGWARGMVSGAWAGGLDAAALAAGLALLFAGRGGGAPGRPRKSHGSPRRPGLPAKGKR